MGPHNLCNFFSPPNRHSPCEIVSIGYTMIFMSIVIFPKHDKFLYSVHNLTTVTLLNLIYVLVHLGKILETVI